MVTATISTRASRRNGLFVDQKRHVTIGIYLAHLLVVGVVAVVLLALADLLRQAVLRHPLRKVRPPVLKVQQPCRRGSGGGRKGVRRGSGGSQEGSYRSSVEARKPRNRDDKVKNTRGILKVCCTSFEQGRRPRAPSLNY
eukprot:1192407-Prorocentrum_minimum.AAC.1